MLIVYFFSVSQCLAPDSAVKDNITYASLPIKSLFSLYFMVYFTHGEKHMVENHLLVKNTENQISHRNIPPCPSPSLSIPVNHSRAPHYAKMYFNFKDRVSKWKWDEASTTH